MRHQYLHNNFNVPLDMHQNRPRNSGCQSVRSHFDCIRHRRLLGDFSDRRYFLHGGDLLLATDYAEGLINEHNRESKL